MDKWIICILMFLDFEWMFSACCKMTRAKIKRAVFLSNAVSVCSKIWRFGPLHMISRFNQSDF